MLLSRPLDFRDDPMVRYRFQMPFTIRDRKTEYLLAEVARLTGDHRSGAIRHLLETEYQRLRYAASVGATSARRWEAEASSQRRGPARRGPAS